ncbi:hypothetical protein pipiens_011495, partial [Culex pipiens pipiens]
MASETMAAATGNGVQKQKQNQQQQEKPEEVVAELRKNHVQQQPKQLKELHYVNPFVHKLVWDDPIDKLK